MSQLSIISSQGRRSSCHCAVLSLRGCGTQSRGPAACACQGVGGPLCLPDTPAQPLRRSCPSLNSGWSFTADTNHILSTLQQPHTDCRLVRQVVHSILAKPALEMCHSVCIHVLRGRGGGGGGVFLQAEGIRPSILPAHKGGWGLHIKGANQIGLCARKRTTEQ